MDLVCRRVVHGERVTTIELVDSAGAFVMLHIEHATRHLFDIPQVGEHYTLAPHPNYPTLFGSAAATTGLARRRPPRITVRRPQTSLPRVGGVAH